MKRTVSSSASHFSGNHKTTRSPEYYLSQFILLFIFFHCDYWRIFMENDWKLQFFFFWETNVIIHLSLTASERKVIQVNTEQTVTIGFNNIWLKILHSIYLKLLNSRSSQNIYQAKASYNLDIQLLHVQQSKQYHYFRSCKIRFLLMYEQY